MALHERPAKSDEWYTPDRVFQALDWVFDQDVCPAPVAAPADRWTMTQGREAWRGCVWMNPPFGGRNGLKPWLDRFFDHGDGVALTPDRTSAPWWTAAAHRCDSVLFVAGKIRFIPGPGAVASSPAQGTSLFAAGPRGIVALRNAERNGLGVLFEKAA